uniref:Uncharacterized protein n=1 Tax=Arundo donax TaxID=35708 RepID=A0A0A8Y762_ARUDO
MSSLKQMDECINHSLAWQMQCIRGSCRNMNICSM